MRPAVVAAIVVLFAGSLLAAITGTVIGPDGAPVANARVALFRPIPQMVAVREVDGEHQPVPLAGSTTDQDGRFSLQSIAAGLVDIHVVAEGFAPADAIVANPSATT